MDKYKRIVGLDGIRGIAIMLVLVEHYFVFTPSTSVVTNALNSFKSLIQTGRLGVDIFFVLSGFLITKLLIDLNRQVRSGEISLGTAWKQFIFRRSLRIFPIYLVSIALFLILVPEYRPLLPWLLTYTTNIGQALSAVGGGGVHFGYLDHFWSLAVEEQFYLLWPVVILFFSDRRFVILMGLLMLSMAVAICLPIMGFPYGFFSRLPIGGCSFALLLGAFIAPRVFSVTLTERKRWQWFFLIFAMPLFIATIVMWKQRVSFEEISVWYLSLVDLSYALVGALLITSVLCNRKLAAVIDNRALAYIGKISYGIYVYHLMLENFFPIMFQFITAAPPGVEFAVYQFLLKTISAVILATISWYAIEKNILKLRNYYP
jgi:peptidoglycan/LPS O-acetylase OafA/YrhL